MKKPSKEPPRPSKASKKATAALTGPPAGEAEAAFARRRAEIEAVPLDQTRRINVHVPAAVATVLGALPRLLALRGEIVALPKQPGGALDNLRDYALAAAFAYVATTPYGAGETVLRARLGEATPLRDRLLVGAEALAHAGVFDPTHVAAIRSGSGHLDTAGDLIALGALFRARWGEVSTKTAVERVDVDRAAELGSSLLEMLGQRKVGTDDAGALGKNEELLRKAFELFFRTYDECRRAVMYLRWHDGDAEQIAPSLFQRRRTSSAPAEEPAPGGEPVDPSASD